MSKSLRDRRRSPGRVAARFVAGRDLDGKVRTDAGFLRPGTKPLTHTGHASKWAHQPHYKRAGIRLTATAGVAATTVGLAVDPAAVAATYQTGAWGAGAIGCYAVYEKTYRYAHFRGYVLPTAEVLRPRVGWPATKNPRDWVDVPRGHREDPDKVVTIYLPSGMPQTEAKKREILGLAKNLLGMHSAEETWTAGESASLQLRVLPLPPKSVGFDRILADLERAPWTEPVIGVGARNLMFTASYDTDSPHWLCSFGSGGGKSVLGRLLAAQFRHHGGRVIIGDSVKRGASHKWAKDLDGVTVLRSAAALHEALVALSLEVSERCELAWNEGAVDATPVLLIMEEANATAGQLQSYWKDELGGKGKSPAVKALADILCVGREAKTHVVTFAQQGTAAATGGGAGRENYGVRALARFTRNTAKMLVPELAPQFPKSSRHKGFVQFVIDGEATPVQVAFLTEAQAREWALSGRPAGYVAAADEVGAGLVAIQRDTLGSPVGPRSSDLLHAGEMAGNVSGDSEDDSEHDEAVFEVPDDVRELLPRAHNPFDDEVPDPEPRRLVTYAEAGDGMVVDLPVGTLKKAITRARQAGEPTPTVHAIGKRGVHMVDPDELRAWVANRPGSGAMSGSSRGDAP